MGERNQKHKVIRGSSAVVYMHSSKSMVETPRDSIKLMLGASVFLPDAEWDEYLKLYHWVYCLRGLDRLRDDGYFVLIQTDAYHKNKVIPRNCLLVPHLIENGFDLIDTKVWKRSKINFFQPPFSLVWIFRKWASKARRPNHKDYRQGVWDYPMTKGGRLNGWPVPLCRLLVESFTSPGDRILDPFCGTATLLGVASQLGRRSIGYEIDRSLIPIITKNINPSGLF